MALKNDTLAGRYGLPAIDYADHGGGFPIMVRGVGVIGTVVVSGLAQQDDHMAIVDVLAEVLDRDPTALRLDDVGSPRTTSPDRAVGSVEAGVDLHGDG